MWQRIRKVVLKEFIQIRRDRGLLRMVLLAPLLQLLIYGYVVATDIRALPMVVLDRTASSESRRLVDRFVVLNEGALLAEGLPQDITRNSAVIDAYLGKRWRTANA